MLCPHCDRPATFQFTAHDINRGKPGSFDYYIGPCGLVFIGEIPETLANHYEGGFQPIPASEAALAQVAKGERYRLDPILAQVPSGRFLEIGPWIGLTAYNAHQLGYEVTALELDTRCVNLLNRSGIRAIQTNDPARELASADEQYDVIALWHSIEHLPRPWEVIDMAAQRLAPSGLLYIAAPNPESAQMQLYRERWFHLDAPRHLYFLPAGMIEDIGSRHGLVVVDRTTDDRLGAILDRDGWRNPLLRHVPIPGVRRLFATAVGKALQMRHRKKGDFAGAGFSLALRRPDERV